MEDEHLLRRIGGAVLIQWEGLPIDARQQILTQAALMFDRQPCGELPKELERFVRRFNPNVQANTPDSP